MYPLVPVAPPAPTSPGITSSLIASGTEGLPFSYQTIATGSAPITFSSTNGALLATLGLAINGAGLISGTVAPSTAGVHNINLTAANGVLPNDVRTLVITISAPSTGDRIYYGEIGSSIPGSFNAAQIQALARHVDQPTRAGTFEFPETFGEFPDFRAIAWPSSYSIPGVISIKSSGFDLPLNPAVNTKYQTLSISGVSYDVFVTATEQGEMSVAGGNPVIIT